MDANAAPSGSLRITNYQETSAGITYRGSWSRALHRGYLGRGASSSIQPGASATLRFTGTGISWIGPVGPTRGQAKIYVDGRYIKTVDTYSRRFAPSRVLFSATYKTERPRTLTIEVLGTKGHPTVALDMLVVRSHKGLASSPGSPLAPTPTPTPIATPTGAPPQTPSVQTSALNITSVAATGITSTGATISWNAGEPATGQVEFGTTSAYGQASKLEASFNYQSHIQTLSGLQSGTRYHFRVRSTDQAGNTAVSPDQVFSTTGSASSSTVTPAPTAGGSTPAPTSTTAPTPPPVVVVPAAAGSTYGVGIGGDTRNNHRIDGTVVSYRFRATTSAAPSSIKVSERTGSGYSAGTGGTIRATVEADNGGKPSGTPLASISWNPGNPGTNEQWPEHFFASASPLVAGQLYHVVFRNVDASPSANYISLNSLYTYSGAASKPLFGADFALLEDGSVRSGDIPIFDLAYADGTHDGQSYIGNLISNYGVVAGSSSLVREHFTVSGGNRTVASASVRVRRTSGSAPLIIRLETSDGTLIDQGAVAASSIAQSAAGGDNGGSVWATVAFGSSHVLANGQTYNLVISCADGTEYTAAPLQEGTTKGLRSWAFTDGQAEKTTNGGSSWSALVTNAGTAAADLQFFFQ